MRQVIIECGDLFKKDRTAKITVYIQEQYNRSVVYNDTAISLHDVPERDVVCAVMDVVEQLDLSFSQLAQYVQLVPAIDRHRNRVTAVAEVNADYFKSLLNSASQIKVDTSAIIYDTDEHVVTGSSSHVDIKHNPKTADSSILAAVLNLTVKGERCSSGIGFGELQSIQASYIDIKFGGLNPFTEEEWEDIYIASAFRRLLKDDALIMVLKDIQGPIYEAYHAAIEHHSKFFQKQQEADNVVRNAFGSIIGRKVPLFSPEELAKEMQRDRVAPNVVPFKRKSENEDEGMPGVEAVDAGAEAVISNDPGQQGLDALEMAMAGDFSYMSGNQLNISSDDSEDDEDDIILGDFYD
jgi:hypothetical protein